MFSKLKKEIVLITASFFAIITMFIIPPNFGYVDYIDFSVLAVLFCLMAVVAGFIRSGLFDFMSSKLLDKSDNVRILSAVFIGLCFFTSMFITNDVALITFVPLTLTLLHSISPKRLIYVITLETIAANLGSMLTPIGNPQNLYIYSYYNMDMASFIKIVFPICLISFVLIGIMVIFTGNEKIIRYQTENKKINNKLLILYIILFVLAAVTVLRIIDYKICLIITVILLIIFDRGVFTKVDYSLLATFLAFFIFVGNLGNIGFISDMLSKIIKGREFLTSVIASQIISNVPAAVMMSRFTDNATDLLRGVNVGGLGTLVASLASLISFKLYIKTANAKPLTYIGIFTLINAILLTILILLNVI